VYALVDCNSFFASCEQIFRPDLRNKPVVVLSNNDGCVVARSKEAKALNIPDLHAYFKIRHLLAYHQVAVFSSNYELYGDISNRVVDVLSEFAPSIEVYSIDESFLLLDGLQENWYEYGLEMKRIVWRDIRMPVSVGIAQTKTLAKLANHIAKQSKKLNGSCVIENSDEWDKVFQKIAVNKIWGVGNRLKRRLAHLDIHSVYDLKKASPKHLRKHCSVGIERTISELNGERCIAFDEVLADKKQIFSTRSFGQRVYHIEALHQAVSEYATRAAIKLRKQQSLTSAVLVFIETSRFDKTPLYRRAVFTLPYPTNDTRMIISAAKNLVTQLYEPGYSYAKAGVGLLDLLAVKNQQLNFFNAYQSKKSERLMAVVDAINSSGTNTVAFASSGVNPFWQMQRKMKSPAYTTRVGEVVGVRV
jgi:DNA polymerase V